MSTIIQSRLLAQVLSSLVNFSSIEVKHRLKNIIATMAKLSGILILFAAILCAVLVIQTVEGMF